MFTFKFFIPSLLAVVSAAPFYGTVLERDEQSLETYDYIIIGAGTAGLTVANRLTENPRITVLVLEAGGLDQQNCDAILQRCLGGLANSEFDWGISTVPQAALGPSNAVQRLYLGKAVGGSSLLNGMMFDRPSPSDIDAWEELGNPGWNWKGLLPYYKKSEKFTPPSAEQIAEFGITYDPSAHGYDGHIESSYPNYLYPHTKNFQDALKSLGVPYSTDQARSAIGAFWSPNNLEHVNQTRSYARSGHYEPSKQRKNFHVLTGRHVTKLLSKTRAGKVEITGVEYATNKTSARLLAKAKKEYILSAGTVHDPQILQLSGIGPAALLKSKKIPVVVDLPGVGNNLQDHPYALVELELDVPHHVIDLDRDPVWDAEAKELYYTNRTGPWTAGGPNSVAFLPLSMYSSRGRSSLQSYSKQSPAQYLRSGIDKRVIAGHIKQRNILLNRLATPNMAAMEFIWISGAARFFEEPLMLSVQHPFSRGFVEINTTDPFTAPVVDLRTGSNPMDVDMYIDAVRFSRKILATPAIQSLDPVELVPGPEVTTDSGLREFAKNGLTTMFHPAGTSAMQKREFGGVVDSKLKVYGTSNLRVVDASIMPVIVAAHLQATTYAIAEKAADMIKAAQS